MRVLALSVAALCLAQLPSVARAEYATIEDAAIITEDNVFRFETDSVTREGVRLRFDVTVAWREGFVRPPEAPPRKVIRYLADCKAGELALSSVALFPSGNVARKTFGIAPGGWDFVKPETASREAGWLKKACDAVN